MRIAVIVSLIAASVLTVGAGASAAAVNSRTQVTSTALASTAYVYGNLPSTKRYDPDANYSFNSAGGSIHIKRPFLGRYSITFTRLGRVADQGTVNVSSEGAIASLCTVVSWGSVGANLVVNIDCFTPGGVPHDEAFMASFTSGGSTTGTLDYLLADRPTTDHYKPSAAKSFNSSGGKNKIRRLGTGDYEAQLPGPIVVGGTVKVSAYGSTPASCQVVGWLAKQPGQRVHVSCFDTDGALGDHPFTMTYAATDSLVGNGASSGYVWGNDPTSESYTPNGNYAYDTAGTAPTVTKQGTGHYEVAFPAAGVGNFGDAQVTVYGSSFVDCAVDDLTGSVGGQQTADVRCFNNSGVPSDAQYTLQWWDE